MEKFLCIKTNQDNKRSLLGGLKDKFKTQVLWTR